MVSSAFCSLLMKPVYTVIFTQQRWDTLTEQRSLRFDLLSVCVCGCFKWDLGGQLHEEVTHDGIYCSHKHQFKHKHCSHRHRGVLNVTRLKECQQPPPHTHTQMQGCCVSMHTHLLQFVCVPIFTLQCDQLRAVSSGSLRAVIISVCGCQCNTKPSFSVWQPAQTKL